MYQGKGPKTAVPYPVPHFVPQCVQTQRALVKGYLKERLTRAKILTQEFCTFSDAENVSENRRFSERPVDDIARLGKARPREWLCRKLYGRSGRWRKGALTNGGASAKTLAQEFCTFSDAENVSENRRFSDRRVGHSTAQGGEEAALQAACDQHPG